MRATRKFAYKKNSTHTTITTYTTKDVFVGSMGSRKLAGMGERSDKDRTTINLTPLKARLEQLRADSAWKALSLSKKVILLLEEYLDLLEQGNGSGSDTEVAENLEQMGEFVKLLMGLRSRNGLSFAEIADITGLPSHQLEEFYQLVEKCRKQHESQK